MIAVGTQAPEFSLPDESGQMRSLSEFRGKKVVLIFYPGDNTPVCTTQLCNYRDNYDAFKERGIELLGISTDGVKSHEQFAGKYAFPFPLLSDADKTVHKLYDTLGFLGLPNRAYVMIDEHGKVVVSFAETLPVFFRTPDELFSKADAAVQ
ncbi:MAG: redoxin [[Candidatus Thermochlorobacteriaceae] bacterium GBChlB]|nr:MAG: redoxin [[Candidatus Thermochlorobacteriaceae] bacterium GBChlB]